MPTSHSQLLTPAPWVEKHGNAPPKDGNILDIACGNGRHARFFAERGYSVTVVDRDVSSLIQPNNFEIVEADLENAPWPFPGRQFAGIVVVNYLYRPLLATLIDSLQPGGVLIYQTFAVGNEAHGRPKNPDFLLRENELLDVFGERLRVVEFWQGLVDGDHPAVIQQICAVNQPRAFPVGNAPGHIKIEQFFQ